MTNTNSGTTQGAHFHQILPCVTKIYIYGEKQKPDLSNGCKIFSQEIGITYLPMELEEKQWHLFGCGKRVEHSCWKGLYVRVVKIKPLEAFFYASSGGHWDGHHIDTSKWTPSFYFFYLHILHW